MRQTVLLGLLISVAFPAVGAAAEQKKTRDEMVHDDRDALVTNETWIYNDLKSGFAQAEASKKPLMVIHRCIP